MGINIKLRKFIARELVESYFNQFDLNNMGFDEFMENQNILTDLCNELAEEKEKEE